MTLRQLNSSHFVAVLQTFDESNPNGNAKIKNLNLFLISRWCQVQQPAASADRKYDGASPDGVEVISGQKIFCIFAATTTIGTGRKEKEDCHPAAADGNAAGTERIGDQQTGERTGRRFG